MGCIEWFDTKRKHKSKEKRHDATIGTRDNPKSLITDTSTWFNYCRKNNVR